MGERNKQRQQRSNVRPSENNMFESVGEESVIGFVPSLSNPSSDILTSQ